MRRHACHTAGAGGGHDAGRCLAAGCARVASWTVPRGRRRTKTQEKGRLLCCTGQAAHHSAVAYGRRRRARTAQSALRLAGRRGRAAGQHVDDDASDAVLEQPRERAAQEHVPRQISTSVSRIVLPGTGPAPLTITGAPPASCSPSTLLGALDPVHLRSCIQPAPIFNRGRPQQQRRQPQRCLSSLRCRLHRRSVLIRSLSRRRRRRRRSSSSSRTGSRSRRSSCSGGSPGGRRGDAPFDSTNITRITASASGTAAARAAAAASAAATAAVALPS